MVQEVSSSSSDMRVYPSLPLLNFLGLLLLAIQRGGSDLYKQLAKHYAPYLKEVTPWNDGLAQIGEMYFGIRIPRQGNPLFDMMGSMMGFGAPAKPASPRPGTPKAQPKASESTTKKLEEPKKVEEAPPTMDLD